VNLLFIGDVVGRPGREGVAKLLPGLRRQHHIAFTIANAENSAGGMGVTADTADQLLSAGVDVLTTGNHVWRRREALPFLDQEPRLLRPANYPPGAPGRGAGLFVTADNHPVAVLNLLGRTFMGLADCPFRAADREIELLRGKTSVIVVDMHAEATSEKLAMGWCLDGRVSAVIGTHTHVQTADERLLPQGTAYITDVGMTGPRDSILGVRHEAVISRFFTGLPGRFEVADGPVVLSGVVVEIDFDTGRANSIRRVLQLATEEPQPTG